jgi:hypothetical protein
MVHLPCAYLPKKHIQRSFWYFLIKHAAKMMNFIPRKYKGKLVSLFMLVHGVHPDQQAWLPIFSLCYFHHERDIDALHLKNQAHTLNGIVISQSSISTAILIYNPWNQQYYQLDSYRIDPYCPCFRLTKTLIMIAPVSFTPSR